MKSLVSNVKDGNVLGAAIDVCGIIADAAAIAVPLVPGGASAAIKATRVVGEVASKTGSALIIVDGVKNGDAVEVLSGVTGVLGGSSVKAEKSSGVVADNRKYQVGSYKDIKGADELDAHHVGQKALMKKMIEGYDEDTASAINIPSIGHTKKGPNGIVSRSTKDLSTPQQVVDRDIQELKRVYPDIPDSKLQELRDLNKKMYPDYFD